MNRKSLLVCLICALILIAANVLAVIFLYLPADPEGEKSVVTEAVDSVAVQAEDSIAVKPVEVVVEDEPQDSVATVDVKVPEGPFAVKNSATGLMNQLMQNADNSLTLLDNKGVAQWTVPFPRPLCGRVKAVDYFANGKLQYLMATGDQLYLVDRLGRTVEGFPVKLSSKVLVGPDVYDFRGIRKYNIVVLNEDNSIDMYNLKGEKPASWKTIRVSDRILGTPEFFELGQKSYWIVQTATQNHVFSFYGDLVKVFDGEVDKTQLN